MIKKNLDLIIVGFIMVSLVLYETTFELLEEFLHLLLELLHALFEWVELGIEHIVDAIFASMEIGEFIELLFTTERHGSQVVTFYILMSIIGFGVYKLSKFVPGSYEFLKQQLLINWIRRKTQFQLYWYSLTILHKVALFATAISVAYLASFFII